ncbi:MAG: right-handed parallel beta-helix repeat-containing protein [Acidobacteriota bacterium]
MECKYYPVNGALTSVFICVHLWFQDEPGGNYRVVKNLECGPGTAILITGDNIRFDLGNRMISGPDGTGFSVGVGVSSSGVEIFRGTINEFNAGMGIEGSNARIHDLEIADCDAGISLFVSTADVYQNLISNCEFGIDVDGATNILVRENVILSSTRIGVFVHPSNTTTNSNNIVRENAILEIRDRNSFAARKRNSNDVREYPSLDACSVQLPINLPRSVASNRRNSISSIHPQTGSA